MYSDHLENWLDFGHRLLIFFILAMFWLSETGQICDFRAFPFEHIGGLVSNLACWCILTTFRKIWILVRVCWYSWFWRHFDLVKQVKFGISARSYVRPSVDRIVSAILHNTIQIHFVFTHLSNPLQWVCSVLSSVKSSKILIFSNFSKFAPLICVHVLRMLRVDSSSGFLLQQILIFRDNTSRWFT